MDSTHFVTWKQFKDSMACLGDKRMMYIDEEGTEIPINTDVEFQEALRLAKQQGNRIRFALMPEGYDLVRRTRNSKSKDKFAYKDVKYFKGWLDEGHHRESKEALYVNDVPPEWFLSYMKKFKKELLSEVNNTVHETIRKAFKKEAKLYDERLAKDYEWENERNCVGTQYYYRSDSGYNTPAYFLTSQQFPSSGSVKLRSTDKVYLDQIREERRNKQFAKMEKARQISSLDRRQKSDKWMNVPTIGLEERMRTPKFRPYPKVYVTHVHDFGPIKPMKSASFTSNLSLKKLEVLQPYALWFLLGNNGSVPWTKNAYVRCYYNPDEFEFEDDVIGLPRLDSGVGANVVYEVTPLKVGSFSFTCAIIDNEVEIGERILCRFDVVNEEGRMPKGKVPTVRKESHVRCEDYDTDVVRAQKKIKDNIKTIMKRLNDIEVLTAEQHLKDESKKKEEDTVKVGQKRNRKKRREGATIELRTGVFDLLQNLESIRENEEGKPKDDEKEIVKDILIGAEDKKDIKEDKKDKRNENVKNRNEDEDGSSDRNQSEKKEAADTERRDSDSELSVIMGSEEDDNFIVLSMPSRTPSPETEVKELKRDQDEDKENDKGKEKEKEKEKEKNAKQKESPRGEEKKSTFESNGFDPWNERINRESTRFDPWNEKKSQPDPFDDAPKDGGRKKKWGFHFVNFPEGSTRFAAPQFCFVDSRNTPEEMLNKLKNNTFGNKNGKVGGNVVFVVDRGGKCVPVVNGKQKNSAEAGKRQESTVTKENKEKESQDENSEASSSERSVQTKEGQDPRNSPNLLLYNAASDAITRVASVFNSIHSAFLPGGTERRTERIRGPLKLNEALDILDDMGFTDRIKNHELLTRHNLNMPAVIEELIETSPGYRENPPEGVFVSRFAET